MPKTSNSKYTEYLTHCVTIDWTDSFLISLSGWRQIRPKYQMPTGFHLVRILVNYMLKAPIVSRWSYHIFNLSTKTAHDKLTLATCGSTRDKSKGDWQTDESRYIMAARIQAPISTLAITWQCFLTSDNSLPCAASSHTRVARLTFLWAPNAQFPGPWLSTSE